MSRANNTLDAWQRARIPADTNRSFQQQHKIKWQPPPAGFVKCNGAVCNGRN
ncbi:hypothetical protein A2U01_0090963, partial [Trifolium medium]|nr:hypothetical protein [Trifolium medium]